MFLEDPVEVTEIGKAAFRGDIGDGTILPQEFLRPPYPQVQLVGVGGDAEPFPEVPNTEFAWAVE